MPTREGYTEGIPSWVDLGTTDVDGARSFYAALFGWEYQDEDTGSGAYTMAYRNGLAAAGIGALQGEASPSWTSYFAVDDANRIADAIEEHGGHVSMGPADVAEAGRMAIASDPAGATFGIWQAGRHFGAAIVNEHGGLNWNELITDDIDAVAPFYQSVFGYDVEPENGYRMFRIGGREVAGGGNKPRPDIPNHWNVYFAVADMPTAITATESGGGTIVIEPRVAEGVGVIARISDPQGAAFNIIELAVEID
ncbi:MAG: VOC family protein [Acidimicrobiia bacterium]